MEEGGKIKVYNAPPMHEDIHRGGCCSNRNEERRKLSRSRFARVVLGGTSNVPPKIPPAHKLNCVILWKCRALALISDFFNARRRSSPNFSTAKLPITEP